MKLRRSVVFCVKPGFLKKPGYLAKAVLLGQGFKTKFSMIELSKAAATEIGRLKLKQQPNVLFRLAVKRGGCSGWYYDMSFDEAVQVGERVFDSQGIRIVIDAESLKYIQELTLDYSEDLMGGGFRFHNPQAKATCGCGNSFLAKNE